MLAVVDGPGTVAMLATLRVVDPIVKLGLVTHHDRTGHVAEEEPAVGVQGPGAYIDLEDHVRELIPLFCINEFERGGAAHRTYDPVLDCPFCAPFERELGRILSFPAGQGAAIEEGAPGERQDGQRLTR